MFSSSAAVGGPTQHLLLGRESAAMQSVLRCYWCQRGAGSEPNSLGSNSPFRIVALFRKVIYPRAAPSLHKRYIIDKHWHSSIHSSRTLPPCCQASLSLALHFGILNCLCLAKKECQKTNKPKKKKKKIRVWKKFSYVYVCGSCYVSHIIVPLYCRSSVFQ